MCLKEAQICPLVSLLQLWVIPDLPSGGSLEDTEGRRD